MSTETEPLPLLRHAHSAREEPSTVPACARHTADSVPSTVHEHQNTSHYKNPVLNDMRKTLLRNVCPKYSKSQNCSSINDSSDH